ncbi:MAG: hypothetical protein HY927_00745 [Elusimicrobia bacterium]|nr:hypothetical protein [Elusimicrobiota bacterium]
MTERFSRPATIEDLKTLIRSFNQENVDYLLIGGYALYAHGYNRATIDIDVLIPAGVDMGKRVRKALMALPDRAARAIEPAWFEEGAVIRVADEFVVDLMFDACGKSYEDLKGYAETVELDGIPIRTINLEGLLLTKQTVRDKDKADRLVIEKALEKRRLEGS